MTTIFLAAQSSNGELSGQYKRSAHWPAIILTGTKMHSNPQIVNAFPFFSLGTIASMRTLAAKIIQNQHKMLANEIKEHGLLQSGFEKYPKGWHTTTVVSETHPIFHVKANGNLVFHPPTRQEYARMRFQETKRGWLDGEPTCAGQKHLIL